MKKEKFTETLIKSIKYSPNNYFFIIICSIAMLLPMVATIGQFYHTNYFAKQIPLSIVYWPGTNVDFKINTYVWISMGFMLISFIAGLYYTIKHKTIGRIVVITILVFIVSTLVRSALTHIFGLQESPLPNLAGKANSVILSLWHNPIWEEIVFRGIPLAILLFVEKYITKKRTLTGVLIYYFVPSILCGIYHIPGHGIIRFFDTLIIASVFTWMTLKFTFFAPVIMHYVADAILVLNIYKIKTINPSEIEWIISYGKSLNTLFSLLMLLIIIAIPTLIIFYYTKFRKQQQSICISSL